MSLVPTFWPLFRGLGFEHLAPFNTIFVLTNGSTFESESGCCRRHFYIVSDMHQKVLDIEGGSKSPGARVIVWPKKVSSDCQNQLWYFDENGIIRSALNDFALTSEGQPATNCQSISIAVPQWLLCLGFSSAQMNTKKYRLFQFPKMWRNT